MENENLIVTCSSISWISFSLSGVKIIFYRHYQGRSKKVIDILLNVVKSTYQAILPSSLLAIFMHHFVVYRLSKSCGLYFGPFEESSSQNRGYQCRGRGVWRMSWEDLGKW
jgi:hypothetical protein